MIWNQIWNHLDPDHINMAKKAGLTEKVIENAARNKGYSFDDIVDRIEALDKGKIAGNPELLEYPVDTLGRISAAYAYATKYGRSDVIANLKKMAAAGIIK